MDDLAPASIPPSAGTSRRQPILSGAVLPLVITVVLAALLWSFSIDDAAISFRYARHLAAGQGLSWNPGGQAVEGYSNFLWVLILAAFGRVGFDIEIAAKITGVVCGGVNLLLLSLLCRRLWPSLRYWWLPAVLVSLTPTWVAWSVSGLEIPMMGTFLLISALALSDPSRIRGPLLALGLGGMILTRPEGLVFAAIILLIASARDRVRTWRNRVGALRYPLLVVLGVAGALTIFRLLYYGTLFPNTVTAKFSFGLPGWSQAAQWVLFGIPFWLVWVLAGTEQRRTSHRLLFVVSAVLIVCQILITATVVPVMNFLHRYQVALLPLVMLPVPSALDRLDRLRSMLGALFAVFLVLWSLQDWFVVRERQAAAEYLRRGQRCITEHLLTLPDLRTVALVDAGCISYWTDLPTLDVWGLCDREIARTGFSAGAVVARNPEVYVMSVDVTESGDLQPRLGMDRAMMNDSLFREGYGLWKYCLGGTTTTIWRYDYAILLNKAWAESRGLRLRAVS